MCSSETTLLTTGTLTKIDQLRQTAAAADATELGMTVYSRIFFLKTCASLGCKMLENMQNWSKYALKTCGIYADVANI